MYKYHKASGLSVLVSACKSGLIFRDSSGGGALSCERVEVIEQTLFASGCLSAICFRFTGRVTSCLSSIGFRFTGHLLPKNPLHFALALGRSAGGMGRSALGILVLLGAISKSV